MEPTRVSRYQVKNFVPSIIAILRHPVCICVHICFPSNLAQLCTDRLVLPVTQYNPILRDRDRDRDTDRDRERDTETQRHRDTETQRH